jgi:hypothetical protein
MSRENEMLARSVCTDTGRFGPARDSRVLMHVQRARSRGMTRRVFRKAVQTQC